MTPEGKILREVLVAANNGNVRLFRNNIVAMKHKGRFIKAGIPGPGGSDLIGWKSVIVTPEMVGTRVAIFTSVEVKTPKGRLGDHQKRWLSLVESFGGVAIVARSADDIAPLKLGE